MTSHSSQGQTADRVLIHVDTELGVRHLLNSRMAYVSVSRGRYDAQIYTNNGSTLGQELSRDVSRALIRRASRLSPENADVYVFADVKVDFSKTEITRGGEKITVTPKEFKTLEFLTKTPTGDLAGGTSQ